MQIQMQQDIKYGRNRASFLFYNKYNKCCLIFVAILVNYIFVSMLYLDNEMENEESSDVISWFQEDDDSGDNDDEDDDSGKR